MPRELIVGWAGRRQRQPWSDLCEALRKRIQPWCPVRELVVRSRGGGGGPARRDAEGAALLEALPERCRTVALTRVGRQMSSPEFADWLCREQETWPHAIAFLVGSDLGLSPAVLEASSLRLSLGPMTMPHEVARLVLHEQIYRAFAIRRGIKYHRAPF